MRIASGNGFGEFVMPIAEIQMQVQMLFLQMYDINNKLHLTTTSRFRILPDMKIVLGSIDRLDVGSATPRTKA